MNQQTFSLTTGVVFLLIALLHVLRLVFEWEGTLQGRSVPMWVSGVGILVAGYLAYEGFRLSKKSQ